MGQSTLSAVSVWKTDRSQKGERLAVGESNWWICITKDVWVKQEILS